MKDFQKFQSFMNEYNSHYRELLSFETKKLRLIADDDIDELRKSLNAEQAMIMKTNSLEKKRMELLSNGDEKKTMRELIEEAPNDIKGSLTNSYNELSKLIFQIRKINVNAQEIVSQRLNILEEIKSGTINTYTKGGVKKHQSDVSSTLDKGI